MPRWLPLQIGRIVERIRACESPQQLGDFFAVIAPGVWRVSGDNHGMVCANRRAFCTELNPNATFQHEHGFFHGMLVQWDCCPWFNRIHQ